MRYMRIGGGEMPMRYPGSYLTNVCPYKYSTRVFMVHRKDESLLLRVTDSSAVSDEVHYWQRAWGFPKSKSQSPAATSVFVDKTAEREV